MTVPLFVSFIAEGELNTVTDRFNVCSPIVSRKASSKSQQNVLSTFEISTVIFSHLKRVVSCLFVSKNGSTCTSPTMTSSILSLVDRRSSRPNWIYYPRQLSICRSKVKRKKKEKKKCSTASWQLAFGNFIRVNHR